MSRELREGDKGFWWDEFNYSIEPCEISVAHPRFPMAWLPYGTGRDERQINQDYFAFTREELYPLVRKSLETERALLATDESASKLPSDYPAYLAQEVKKHRANIEKLETILGVDADTVSDDDAMDLTESRASGVGRIGAQRGDVVWTTTTDGLRDLKLISGTVTYVPKWKSADFRIHTPQGTIYAPGASIFHTKEEAVDRAVELARANLEWIKKMPSLSPVDRQRIFDQAMEMKAELSRSPDTVSDDDAMDLTEAAPTSGKLGRDLLAATFLGNINEVRHLLDAGAKVNVKNPRGRTPLFIAADRGWGDIVKLLLERGADPTIYDSLGRRASDVSLYYETRDLLLDAEDRVGNPNTYGDSHRLHRALRFKNVKELENFIEEGKDLNIPVGRYASPVSYVATYWHGGPIQEQMLKMMLRGGLHQYDAQVDTRKLPKEFWAYDLFNPEATPDDRRDDDAFDLTESQADLPVGSVCYRVIFKNEIEKKDAWDIETAKVAKVERRTNSFGRTFNVVFTVDPITDSYSWHASVSDAIAAYREANYDNLPREYQKTFDNFEARVLGGADTLSDDDTLDFTESTHPHESLVGTTWWTWTFSDQGELRIVRSTVIRTSQSNDYVTMRREGDYVNIQEKVVDGKPDRGYPTEVEAAEDALHTQLTHGDPTRDPYITRIASARRWLADHGGADRVSDDDAMDITEGSIRWYVAVDGDNIGNKASTPLLHDDVDTASDVSKDIKSGQKLIAHWVKAMGGKVFVDGGDNTFFEIPCATESLIVERLEDLRRKYKTETAFTLSAGVGRTPSHASKSLVVAKAQGKDRVVAWSDDTQALYGEAMSKANDALKLARESGLVESTASAYWPGIAEGYVENAIWASEDYLNEMRETDGKSELKPSTNLLAKGTYTLLERELETALKPIEPTLCEAALELGWERMGGILYLACYGHGVGFYAEKDLREDLAKKLDAFLRKLSHSERPPTDVYWGDDDRIYLSGCEPPTADADTISDDDALDLIESKAFKRGDTVYRVATNNGAYVFLKEKFFGVDGYSQAWVMPEGGKTNHDLKLALAKLLARTPAEAFAAFEEHFVVQDNANYLALKHEVLGGPDSVSDDDALDLIESVQPVVDGSTWYRAVAVQHNREVTLLTGRARVKSWGVEISWDNGGYSNLSPWELDPKEYYKNHRRDENLPAYPTAEEALLALLSHYPAHFGRIHREIRDNILKLIREHSSTSADTVSDDDAMDLTESEQKPFLDAARIPFEEGTPTPQKLKLLKEWIAANNGKYQNISVVLYHGTDGNLPVLKKGLLPTSTTRRRSYQSASGYVYLANTPERALQWAKLANPMAKPQVYAVRVLLRNLLPDLDQLTNQKVHGYHTPPDNSLAASILYGGGARVKGRIHAYDVRPINP